MKELTIKLFGGDGAEGYNALMQALHDCAEDEEMDVYTWLDKIPKTSLVVHLVNKLKEYGYSIKRNV
ncbi:MAG: hypothetical protein ACLGJB_02975 [Blastocatellia bacterium]